MPSRAKIFHSVQDDRLEGTKVCPYGDEGKRVVEAPPPTERLNSGVGRGLARAVSRPNGVFLFTDHTVKFARVAEGVDIGFFALAFIDKQETSLCVFDHDATHAVF